MNYSYNPNCKGEYVKAQKQGPQSISVILPKTMTKNLGIQKGNYVLIFQIGTDIIIRKV